MSRLWREGNFTICPAIVNDRRPRLYIAVAHVGAPLRGRPLKIYIFSELQICSSFYPAHLSILLNPVHPLILQILILTVNSPPQPQSPPPSAHIIHTPFGQSQHRFGLFRILWWWLWLFRLRRSPSIRIFGQVIGLFFAF